MAGANYRSQQYSARMLLLTVIREGSFIAQSRKFKKPTDEFVVRADDGKEFVVIELTNYVGVRSQSQRPKILEGLKEYMTSEGDGVNRLSDDTYEILDPVPGPMKATRI